MSADFWAGYLSGAASIVIGNPLDLIKVRLQATALDAAVLRPATAVSTTSLLAGLPAPLLTYGALNGILFASYSQALSALPHGISSGPQDDGTAQPVHPPWAHFLAGTVAGFATFVVSAPTEYVKCRAQLVQAEGSSWAIAKETVRRQGLPGLYVGGAVTSLRDAIGYGFYFWSYQVSKSSWERMLPSTSEASKTLVCGGAAGVATWASVFPLDVIKTRIQTQSVAQRQSNAHLGAWSIATRAYAQEGFAVFWRGLGVCSLRAFLVNAAQWSVYEWAMRALSGAAAQTS